MRAPGPEDISAATPPEGAAFPAMPTVAFAAFAANVADKTQLRDVVAAHLPAGTRARTVPDHDHGAVRPRALQQVPRAHDGVLHRGVRLF